MNRILVGVLAIGVWAAAPLTAQGPGPHHYPVTTDRALLVTRQVLGEQGFEVVRVETHDHDQVVFYRHGNMGKGKGKGRLERMVVRRVENRIVFVDTPDVFLVQLDLRLKL
jgi:hypothetical protein